MSKISQADNYLISKIYTVLLEEYHTCDKLSKNSNENLLGLVFHEIVYFLSSSYFANKWYSGTFDYRSIIFEMPYLGYRRHKSTHINKLEFTSRKLLIINSLKNIIKRNTNVIGIVNPSIPTKELFFSLYKEGIGAIYPTYPKIAIANFDQQFNHIKKCLRKIEYDMGLPNRSTVFLKSLKSSFKKLRSKVEITPNYDCLLIGTPGKFLVRIEAANAFKHNKPVICLAHGNECGTGDLPPWGYDDRSFSTHYIGYGKGGLVDLNKGEYLNTLSGNQPKYIESNSGFIKNIYSKEPIPIIEKLIGKTIGYIPQGFLGNDRLSPFYSISDDEYKKWQNKLVSFFPDLIIKSHPKQPVNYIFENVKIITEPLENCIHYFDIFFVDDVSTTFFANIAATSTPIVYFNIGLGNPTPIANKLINKRCICIDIDLSDIGNLPTILKKKLNKTCVNELTETFSITNHNETRLETTIATITRVLAGQL